MVRDVGFASGGELRLQEPSEVLLTLMLYRWLVDAGIDGGRARILARGLAGL